MKKLILSFLLILFLSFFLFSIETDQYTNFNLGFSVAAGGRYDQVRMCVASPPGAYGGPAFEFAGFVFEYRFNEIFGLGGYIPIGRPILFGAAFQMLQFIPEFIVTFHIPIKKRIEIIIHGALGASFHYGPYITSGLVYKEPSFFAGGPRISLLVGPQFTVKEKYIFIVGLKPYFEYLFSENIQGIIVGGEIDFQFRYSFKIK